MNSLRQALSRRFMRRASEYLGHGIESQAESSLEFHAAKKFHLKPVAFIH